jgi:membrane dipeptidase
MNHIRDLAGNARNIAIGSDLDGGFGLESTPAELDTVADLQKFGPVLRESGYSESDVANILSGNWIRVLERALP